MVNDITRVILDKEAEAYMRQLPQMIQHHEGKWTVFKDGNPLGFWDTSEKAYVEGVRRYGTDIFYMIQVLREDFNYGIHGKPKFIGLEAAAIR